MGGKKRKHEDVIDVSDVKKPKKSKKRHHSSSENAEKSRKSGKAAPPIDASAIVKPATKEKPPVPTALDVHDSQQASEIGAKGKRKRKRNRIKERRKADELTQASTTYLHRRPQKQWHDTSSAAESNATGSHGGLTQAAPNDAHLQVPRTATNRPARASFSQGQTGSVRSKATSIPTFSSGSGCQTARERYEAFRKAAEDGSDEESAAGSDSGESEVQTKRPVRGSISESFADELRQVRSSAKNALHMSVIDESDDDHIRESNDALNAPANTASESKEVGGSDEVLEKGDGLAQAIPDRDDELPTTRGIDPGSYSAPELRANVPVKRRRPRRNPPGGNHYGLGQDENKPPRDAEDQNVEKPLSVEKVDEADVLAAVSETAEFVFNATRALPEDELSVITEAASHQQAMVVIPKSEREAALTEIQHNSRVRRSSSPLSLLSRSPSPPIDEVVPLTPLEATRRRKMTGVTSKHFSEKKQRKKKGESINIETDEAADECNALEAPANASVTMARTTRSGGKRSILYKEQNDGEQDSTDTFHTPEPSDSDQEFHTAQTSRVTKKSTSTKSRKRSTGKTSQHFTPFGMMEPSLRDRVDMPVADTPSRPSRRVPAGTSRVPVPSINESKFGIIQERLWDQPFWLLIAVTFLNKTAGRAAAPIFWSLKARYPAPEALAAAREEDLHDMIYHLGLQNQRAKRLLKIAQAWVDAPPVVGRRSRTLHYPAKDDGKEYKPGEVIESDAVRCDGALEIAHIPGCGAYAYDSWRIFCRDILRGVAEDYRGNRAQNKSTDTEAEDGESSDFEPEWRRVVPLDKELRACLRWMWLRDGWIWDPLTGKKRKATDDEMERAIRGQIEIDDPEEQKFAVKAADHELSGAVEAMLEQQIKTEEATNDKPDVKTPEPSSRSSKRQKQSSKKQASGADEGVGAATSSSGKSKQSKGKTSTKTKNDMPAQNIDKTASEPNKRRRSARLSSG